MSNDTHQTDVTTDRDDEPSGAIDHTFDESALSTMEEMDASVADLDTQLEAGAVALDLVTRQPLFIRRKTADTLVEYYEREDFDLYSYKMHPYLPVRKTDSVFECVFIGHDPQQAHNVNKTYDFPASRLMKVPLAEAWDDE